MSNSRALALPAAQVNEEVISIRRVRSYEFAYQHFAYRAAEAIDGMSVRMLEAKDHAIAFGLALFVVAVPVGLVVMSNMAHRSYGM